MDVSNWLKNSSPYNQLYSPDLNNFMAKFFFHKPMVPGMDKCDLL